MFPSNAEREKRIIMQSCVFILGTSLDKIRVCRLNDTHIRSTLIREIKYYARSHWSIGVFRYEYVNTAVTF